jgi:hypothetical protein
MNKLTLEEAREKRHNPWYCKECGKLVHISFGYLLDTKDEDDDGLVDLEVPYCPTCGTYNVVEKPQRETPEEYGSRTGRPWRDGSAVYMRVNKNDYRIMSFREAKFAAECYRTDNVPHQIYCANSDSGIPGKET